MENEVNQTVTANDNHLSPQELAVWLSRAAPIEEPGRMREHLLRCAACREQMVMLRQATQAAAEMEQSGEFARLLRLGEAAAQRARRQAQAAEPVAEKAAAQPDWRRWFLWQRPALGWAATVVLLLAVAYPAYLFYQRRQPVERAMASLRKAWPRSRPVEARVTGGFSHLPYEVTRGGGSTAPVNEAQLRAALAELTREAADRPAPPAWHALGRLHLLKGEFEQAEAQLKLVVKAEPRNAQAYVDLASAYYERGAQEESMPLFLQAAEHLKTATELAPNLAEAWFNLALCHERMLLFTEAKSDWEQYLKLDSRSEWAAEARERLQKLRERAVLREPQVDTLASELSAAAAENNEAALRRLLEENFTVVTELTAGRLLDDYLAAALAGKRPEADRQQQLLQRLAALIRETKGEHYFADLLRFVYASSPARLEKVRAIRAQLRQAKALLDDYQDKPGIKLAKEAQAAAERIGDVCHTEAALAEIARIYGPETETKEFPLLRQRLLSESARRRHLQMQTRALLALANQYGAERRMSSWLEVDLQALELAKQLDDPALVAATLWDIGIAYADLGEQEQGLKACYTALQRLSTTPLSLNKACLSYVHLARSLAIYGHFREAYSYQREGLQFCPQSRPAVYLNTVGRAIKYAALAGQVAESSRLFQQAVLANEHYRQTINTQPLAVDTYVSLGDALVKSRRFSEAELAYRKAGENLGSLNNLYYQAAIQHGLAAALLPQGKIQEAEAALNKGIEFIEFSRLNVKAATGRSNFVGGQLNVYKSMVEFQYFYRRSAERAFEFSEKYRNRELLDLLDQAHAIAWQEDKRDLKLKASTEPLTLSQIRQALPVNTQIVEYALTEKQLLLWVINREEWLTESVPVTAAQLQALVSAYVQALRERQVADSLNAQAQELYRLLIQPVLRHLKPQHNLVLVPDGVLNSLPFAALVNPVSRQYLVEEHKLTISPSANVLVRILARRQPHRAKPVRSVLAVSDPEFNRQLFPTLSRLPGAQEEVKKLPALYPVFAELPRTQATKEAFLRQAKNFQVLHLAAHSIINANEPLLSAVVLAAELRKQTVPAESLLLAHEIFRLNLPQTRLVILSSCNSLVNQTAGHNGLGGLAHAFFSAGVPTVMGSLWEVNDESTADLMTAFHHNWRSANVSISEALQQAQLTLLRSAKERWRHPANWAAFYVSGDGITI